MLEPSPPAVADGEWWADDPLDHRDVPAGMPVVLPLSEADRSWDTLAAGDVELSAWCADRWLGAWRRLVPLPGGFAAARGALHRLAFYVLSPARRRVNGKIGLRYTCGGFGTPFFGSDEQVRVQGTCLVVQADEEVRWASLTTLRAAADLLGLEIDPAAGAEFDVPSAGDLDEPLPVDEPAVRALSDWYGFVTSVLEELRAGGLGEDPGRVQLWPEHFDVATEFGSEGAQERASFGGSPGDEHHPQPYLYVAPWSEVPKGGFWNDPHFNGASLGYEALLAADDQRGAALEFYRRGRAELRGRE